MASLAQHPKAFTAQNCDTFKREADSRQPDPVEGFEKMARRRYQNPKPTRRGKWWVIQLRRDRFDGGEPQRVNERVKLAPATMAAQEVKKIAAELLRPLNQGLESIGSATNFQTYVDDTYIPVVLRLMAKTTQDRYEGVIRNYLTPAFEKLCLRDLSALTVQRFFSAMDGSLAHESKDKVRDVLASILGSAVEYGLLVRNPVEGVRLPADKKGKRTAKPHITPEQFEQLLGAIPEPYASMFYVAVYTGLRISELVGLRWEDVHTNSITVDERYCRGDWAAPKSQASNATIAVDLSVIERLQRLKLLTVQVKAGKATRRYKLVKSDGPTDLVFQSVRTGAPMRDNNILSRYLKPAGRALGIPWINWRCLRTSYATWMVEAGANPKDVQGQMRHSKISTTMDVYAQFVPESQQRSVTRTSAMVAERRAKAAAQATRVLLQ